MIEYISKYYIRFKILSWAIILFWFLRPLLFRIIHVEFASVQVAYAYRIIWIFLFPVAVAMLHLVPNNKSNLPALKVSRVLPEFFASLFLVAFFSAFSCLCEWSFVYSGKINKQNGHEIKLKSLNCGATDTESSYDYVETYNIAGILVKYKYVSEDLVVDK